MKEEELINNSTDNISDEEFLKNYEKHNKIKVRHNRHNKTEQNKEITMAYIFFLAAVFIVSYYVFTKFLFVPIN